jgi:hypothetical protein
MSNVCKPCEEINGTPRVKERRLSSRSGSQIGVGFESDAHTKPGVQSLHSIRTRSRYVSNGPSDTEWLWNGLKSVAGLGR